MYNKASRRRKGRKGEGAGLTLDADPRCISEYDDDDDDEEMNRWKTEKQNEHSQKKRNDQGQIFIYFFSILRVFLCRQISPLALSIKLVSNGQTGLFPGTHIILQK